MRNFGLIGKTLQHSFSKQFFTEKFKNENIQAQYDLFELNDINEFSHLTKEIEFSGLNVTIPYKEQIIPFLDEIDPTAKAIGAVNTIKFCHSNGTQSLCGYNTDIIGFTDSLLPDLKPYHKKALILGTGGASKAIQYSLQQLGIDTIFVSRTKKEDILCYEDINKDILSDHLLIINCSPAGMFPNIDSAPNIPYNLLTNKHYLFDLVYNPENTLFCQLGKEHGAITKNGLDMLYGQAVASWKIWNK
ncbi:MAG: shikimate dehydrogenase [Paludibacteraceae bacterium]|nr:shikimate dehydrogenase [Paludibacteraceae bacterium]